MSNEEKLVSHYWLKALLRRDGFGAVYLAEDTRDQKELILRVIDLDQKTLAAITGRVRMRSQRDHPLIEQIRQRMKRISELKHAHILSVIEFGEEHIQGNNDIIFYMASPLEKESLLSYWSTHTSSAELISLEIVADLLVQAAEALFTVHKRGLVHQYVRFSSFMLRSTTRGRKHLHLLLTDFWFADISAAILEEGQMAQALSVYLAPEQLATGTAVAASDQYALAVLAYELLLGYRLSQVNLDLMLYENFVHQHGSEVSESDLTLARNIDLVLHRALAENPAARFHTIEAFALAFRAAARGEMIELLADETAKIPVQRKPALAGTEAVAGALIAGEMLEKLAVTQDAATTASEGAAEVVSTTLTGEETQRTHGRGLHKTVLTSAGMETVEHEQSATSQAEATLASETSATARVAEETGEAAGFAAGEAIGAAEVRAEAAQVTSAATAQRRDIAEEQTLIMEGGAAAVAAALAAGAAVASEGSASTTVQSGETTTQRRDVSEEQTLIMEGGAAAVAAGLATGTVVASEGSTSATVQSGETVTTSRDVTKEDTLIMEAGAVGLAAGLVAGAMMASGAMEQAGNVTSGTAGQAGGLAGGAEEQAGNVTSGTGGQAGAAGLAVGAIVAGGAMEQAGNVTSGTAGQARVTRQAGGLAGGAIVASGAMEQAGSVTSGTAGQARVTRQAGAAGLAGGAIVAGGAIEQAGSVTSGTGGQAGVAGQAGGLAGGAIVGGGAIEQAGSVTSGTGGQAGATVVASGQTRSVVSKAVGMAGATMVAGGAMQQAGGVLTSTGGAVRRKRPLLVASLIGLIMLIVIGSAALALFVFAGQSSATITLTPQSHIVQTSYLVTATTGTVNFSQGQVQARTLTSTISLHQSGQASGFFAGVHASGLITFRNISTGCGCPVVIPAGTVFTSGSGITVVIDTAASVASLCSVTVHAHAVNFGPSGNIKAGDVNTSYSPTMLVTNPAAFSGGQAGQSHSVVQQSDINKLSSVLQSQVVQTAQAGISSQLQSHEHLLNAPTCQTQTSADHPAGSVATSVNVTVSTTCTAEAYDYTGAVQWTQQQVQNQALTYFSSTFALVGTVQTQIKSATLVDAQTGKILLEVSAKGTWSYHFSQRMKQTLAAAIHGRDINEARALLANYDGIAGVSIAVAGFDQSKLPSDTSKITIVVKN